MKDLEKILEQLEKTGSNKEELKTISNTLKENLNKGKDMDSIMNDIVINIENETKRFFNEKSKDEINLMTGFTSSIYLPSFDGSGEINLLMTGGTTSRLDNSIKINSKTMFDVASITKLFTLILTYKLDELGIINLNDKISDLNPDFSGLEDYTFDDLIKLHGDIWTNGNVAAAKNEKEAYKLLKTAYLKDNTRETNKYTDFGAIIIGKTIEKVLSKREGKQITLQDLMDKYIFSKADMKNTTFNPSDNNISGNGGYDNLVHDPKARILGGMVGSAGLFTTSQDLNKLAKELYLVNYVNKDKFESLLINKKHLDNLGEITFPNSNQSNKGNLGIYVKHPSGYTKTYTPSLFSDNSFSHQGWTGAVAIFDPNNLIHHNFLVNSIYKTDNKDLIRADKPVGFGSAWEAYQENITNNIMLMMIAKKYFNLYKDKEVNINKEIRIK